MKKNFLFGLLALVLAGAGFGGISMAEEEYVAQIGEGECSSNTCFTNLQSAIGGAQNGNTIKLIKSTNENVVIGDSQELTLEIGEGVVLEGTETAITNNGKLTIKGKGTVKQDRTTHVIKNQGELIIDGVTIEKYGDDKFGYVIENHGITTILDGTLKSTSSKSALIDAGFFHQEQGSQDNTPQLIIKGGNFLGGNYNVKSDSWGIVKIEGGHFENSNVCVLLAVGKTTIDGEDVSFVAGGNSSIFCTYNPGNEGEYGNVVIKNGTFDGKIRDYGDGMEVEIQGGTFINFGIHDKSKPINEGFEIKGGTFDVDVSEYTANDGYSVKNSEGEYEIKALTKTYFIMSSKKNITFPVVLSDDGKNVLLEETKAVLKKESGLGAGALLDQFNALTNQSQLNDNAKIVTIEGQDLLFFKQALTDPTQYKIGVFTKKEDTGKPFSSRDKFIGGNAYSTANPSITFDLTNKIAPFEDVSSWTIKTYNEVEKESKTVGYTLYTQVDPEDITKNQGWFYAPRLYKVTFNSDGGTEYEAQKVALIDGKATNPGNPTKGGVGFKFWSKDGTNEYNFEDAVDDDIELTAIYGTAEEGAFNIIFKNGDIELQKDVLAKDVIPTYLGETPTKAEDSTCNTYEFKEWTPAIAAVSADTTYTATFTCTSKKSSGSSYSGGGGSSKKTETTEDAKATTGDTAKVDDKKVDETKTDETKNDTDNEGSDGNKNPTTFSQEFIDAYNFAYKNGITTKESIEEADMFEPLTRIAMAKMLSQYAINVLGQTPDTTVVVPTFPDVDAKLDADYNNGVTLAYQLGIMGIGIQKFRPFDTVTRAEFGTALSRMLYGTADGEGNEWYSTHLQKLMDEKIITNNNPNLKELRGYVMIMLMRSAQ